MQDRKSQFLKNNYRKIVRINTPMPTSTDRDVWTSVGSHLFFSNMEDN